MKTKAKKPIPVTDEPVIQPQVELKQRLGFSEDNVMSASAEQPILFFQAAEHRIVVYRKYLSAKQELATVRAAVSLSVRSQMAEDGEKVTEGTVDAKTLLNPAVAHAQQTLQEMEAEEEAAKLMLEAYRMRRDSLKVMMEWRSAGLRAQQSLELSGASLEEMRVNLDKRYTKGK